jgi:hypothetical protein
MSHTDHISKRCKPPFPSLFLRPAARLIYGVLLLTAVMLLLQNSAYAMPRIGEVEAFWEDSLAIVQPEIRNPLNSSQRRTLETGVAIRVDVEIRFTRTGYVKTTVVGITVEYDVWTGWYRVTTPLSPFAIEEYPTVERLFEQDLLLLFNTEELDPEREWFIKVRAGTELHEDRDDGGSNHGVIGDLSGFTRLLFRMFEKDDDRGEWSDLVKLPKRSEVLP